MGAHDDDVIREMNEQRERELSSPICAVHWEGTTRLMKALGLEGKRLTDLQLNLSMEDAVRVNVSYSVIPTAAEAGQIIDVLASYELHEKIEQRQTTWPENPPLL